MSVRGPTGPRPITSPTSSPTRATDTTGSTEVRRGERAADSTPRTSSTSTAPEPAPTSTRGTAPSTRARPDATTRADAATRAIHDTSASVRQATLSGPAATAPSGDTGAVAGHGASATRRGGVMRTGDGSTTPRDWEDPTRVLSHLTQRGNAAAPSEARTSEGDRCGAAALLGGAIMNGPSATADLLTTAADNHGNALTEPDRTRLRAIASEVTSGTVPYADLNEAQAILYRAGDTRRDLTDADRTAIHEAAASSHAAGSLGWATVDRAASAVEAGRTVSSSEVDALNRAMERSGHSLRLDNDSGVTRAVVDRADASYDGASGMSDSEEAGLARSTGSGLTRRLGPHEDVVTLLSSEDGGLAPGQAATLRIDPVTGDDDHSASHFVTVGRDPSGRPYIYNPDPGPGDRALVWGDDATRAARDYSTRLDTTHTNESVIISRHR